jgi:hypothetical protein
MAYRHLEGKRWRSSSVSITVSRIAFVNVRNFLCVVEKRTQARGLLQKPIDGVSLMANGQEPTLPAALRLVLMLEQMAHQHLQAALQFTAFARAHPLELLGDMKHIDVGQFSLTQERRVLQHPGLKVLFVRCLLYRHGQRIRIPPRPCNRMKKSQPCRLGRGAAESQHHGLWTRGCWDSLRSSQPTNCPMPPRLGEATGPTGQKKPTVQETEAHVLNDSRWRSGSPLGDPGRARALPTTALIEGDDGREAFVVIGSIANG